MVVKIQPPAENIIGAIMYNENKMDDDRERIMSEDEVKEYLSKDMAGHVVATRNVPQTSSLENEFSRLEILNKKKTSGKKLKNFVFHMSVNPGEKDNPLNEKEITEFIDELMQGLGYGDSPYKIFRHDDTGRTHYHVVSTRIGQDGYKIKDAFENKRCENICRSFEEKYGFRYGIGDYEEHKTEEQVEKSTTSSVNAPYGPDNIPTGQEYAPKKEKAENGEKTGNDKKKRFIPPFSLSAGIAASEQYKTFHAEAMKWSFENPQQYAAILRYRFNTEIDIREDGLYYAGMDSRGNINTVPMNEKELGIMALNDMLRRCQQTEKMKRIAQKERLEGLVQWAMEKSESWNYFRKLMETKGVIMMLSWNREGKLFGVTYLDRATKSVFKASDTSVDLAWLKHNVEERGWKIGRHPRYEKKEPAGKDTVKMTARRKNLEKYSRKENLNRLMIQRGINSFGKTTGSNADASRTKDDIRYGDDRDIHDIII